MPHVMPRVVIDYDAAAAAAALAGLVSAASSGVFGPLPPGGGATLLERPGESERRGGEGAERTEPSSHHPAIAAKPPAERPSRIPASGLASITEATSTRDNKTLFGSWSDGWQSPGNEVVIPAPRFTRGNTSAGGFARGGLFGDG